MHVWIGTSGFQYPEWKGGFYPDDLSAAKMLPYYAERFDSTEINYTFRHLPSAKTIANWDKATPARFRFSFKAPQRITHFARLINCKATLKTFRAAILPMGEKLGPVLLQHPPNFQKDAKRLRDFLNVVPAGIRVTFEFRHESWFDDEIFSLLSEANAALCIAEDEDLATPPEVTADFGYLRLRRIDYSPARLKKWAGFVAAQKRKWKDAFVYFKHEETGVGPRFAQRFARHFAPTKSR